MPAKPIPEGYHTISPSLTVDGAAEAIEFYKRAFGATERSRMPMPDGKIAHAELEIGDSVLMLTDPFPQSPRRKYQRSRAKRPIDLGKLPGVGNAPANADPRTANGECDDRTILVPYHAASF